MRIEERFNAFQPIAHYWFSAFSNRMRSYVGPDQRREPGAGQSAVAGRVPKPT